MYNTYAIPIGFSFLLIGTACNSTLSTYEMGNTQPTGRPSQDPSTSASDVTRRSTSTTIKEATCYACQKHFDDNPQEKTTLLPSCGHRLHTACFDALVGRNYDPFDNMKLLGSKTPSAMFCSVDLLTLDDSHTRRSVIPCPRCNETFEYEPTYLKCLAYINKADTESMQHYTEDQDPNWINRVDKNGNSFLMIACKEAKTEAIKFLLKNLADTNLVNKYGYTAMHYAQSDAIIQLLLKHNFTYDEPQDYTSTIPERGSPLSSLYVYERYTVSRQEYNRSTPMLIDKPKRTIDKNKKNKKNKKIPFLQQLMWLIKCPSDITRLDENTIYQRARKAIRTFDHETFNLILDCYIHSTYKTSFKQNIGDCLASVAIAKDNDRALYALLNHGISPNADGIGVKNSTLLHQASCDGSLKCVKVLLNHKDTLVNAQNHFNKKFKNTYLR